MKTINDVKMLSFPEFGDKDHLVVIEGDKNIPFSMKRVFYIYGADKDDVRGKHANRFSEFCLINVCGTSKVRAADQMGNEKVFVLDRPNVGLYIPTMIWKDMYDFSSDSVLLVLSSEHYNANEYINNFDEFVSGGQK